MENLVGLEDFLLLYNKVKRSLPNYEKKLKAPYSEIVITNYYKIISLLRKYNIYEYLNNDFFQLLFIRMVFDGTLESIESNFAYLKELNDEKGVDILNNVDKLVRLFSRRKYSLINCSLDVVELSHSLIFDTVSSEMVKEMYGSPDEFAYILDNYASGKECPELFWMVFPLFKRSPGSWIGMYLAESVAFQNANNICNEVMVAEVTQRPYNLKNPTLYTVKVREDIEFLRNRYSNLPGYGWSNVYNGLKKLKCYITLMGSFTYLFKKLESLNKNLFGGNFNIFDYFLKPENLPLLDKIVCSLDSYVDYKDFAIEKAFDYNDVVVGLVDELASKLFFYFSLYHIGNEKGVFDANYHTIDVLKIIAQIKKDELDGLITSEEALNKCNILFEYFKDIRFYNHDNIRFHIAQIGFGNLLNSPGYLCSDIDEHNFGFYLSLCDDYFAKNDSVFLSVGDFIVHTLKYNNGYISSKIKKLILTDFNLLNIIPFDLTSISDVDKILQLQKSYKKVIFIDDLYTCSAFSFEEFDIFAETMSPETIDALFDVMAVRYHSRIKFGSFDSNGSLMERERGIYRLKELFRNGTMKWERDRIHVYNYFIYLENNLAHDIDEHVVDYCFKDQDYFSSNFGTMKSVVDKFLKNAEQFMKDNNVANRVDDLLNFVYFVLSNNGSMSDKKDMIERYVGCFGTSIVTDFINSISNDLNIHLSYMKLLREQNQDFKYKSDYAFHIINDFYSKLKIMRVESGTFDPNNLQLTKVEQKAFYERFGYLIDIRYDSSNSRNIPVLYIMDRFMEVMHCVHLKGMETINIKSFDNKELKLDENVDSMFDDCHLKVSKNNRQSILISVDSAVNDDLYSTLKNDFDSAPDFIDSTFIDSLISKHSLFQNYPEFVYYYVCRCLKAWNENEIMGVELNRCFNQ